MYPKMPEIDPINALPPDIQEEIRSVRNLERYIDAEIESLRSLVDPHLYKKILLIKEYYEELRQNERSQITKRTFIAADAIAKLENEGQ